MLRIKHVAPSLSLPLIGDARYDQVLFIELNSLFRWKIMLQLPFRVSYNEIVMLARQIELTRRRSTVAGVWGEYGLERHYLFRL